MGILLLKVLLFIAIVIFLFVLSGNVTIKFTGKKDGKWFRFTSPKE